MLLCCPLQDPFARAAHLPSHCYCAFEIPCSTPNKLLYIFLLFSHIWESTPDPFLILHIQTPNLGDHAISVSFKPVCPFDHCCYCLNVSLHDLAPGKAALYKNKHTNDLVLERPELDSYLLLINSLTLEQ